MYLKRRTFLKIVPAAALAGGAFVPSAAQADDAVTTLKFGTLAPKNSLWGTVFNGWTKIFNEGAVAKGFKTRLMFFYSAQQGDENEMVGKIRKGQLDGAAITAVGLGQIYKPVLVFQMPGLFSSWAGLDAARTAMRPQFDKAFEDAGFNVLGWGDVGEAHIMSKGFEVRVPSDLKKRNPFYLKGDPIGPMFYSVVGEVTPAEVSVPEIATKLSGGVVNVLNTPSLAAEQLMWAQHIDTINKMVTGYGIGALVMSSKRLAALSGPERDLLKETGARAAETLTKVIRAEDHKAFLRLVGSKKSFMPNDDEIKQWNKVFAETRNKLAASTFNGEIVRAVESAARGK
jgi:TRAP-type C4-dicarboxylate transport system substrate-binding protein